MDHIPQQKKKSEWTGYKIATVIISVASILVIFIQAIFNNYYNQRWQEIDYYETKLGNKRQELIKMQQKPKVVLKTQTLEKAGLSKHMLKSLSAIPSTLSIEHVGGETAEGIFLSVKSSEPIIQFQKWESPEDFTVERDTTNNSSIKLHATKLHKGTIIGVTVSTKKPTELDIQLLIDKGEKTEEKKNRSSVLSVLDYKYLLSDLRSDDIRKLIELRDKGLSDEEATIYEEIFLLESKIEHLKSQSLLTWVIPQLEVITVLKLLLLFLLVFGGGLFFFNVLRPDLKKKSMKQQVLNEIKNKDFVPGTVFDLFKRLGCPDSIKMDEVTDSLIKIYWFSKSEILPLKSLQFTFQNNSIVEIFDGDEKIPI